MFFGVASGWHMARSRGRQLARIVLPIVSFLAYASSALLLHQGDDGARRTAFIVERIPIAAAVSNIMYGAPLGRFYEGVRARLTDLRVPPNESLQDVLGGKVPLGGLVDSGDDGIGIGFTVVTTLGMRLFGISVSSIMLTFLFLTGLAAGAFVLRFPNDRSVFVPLTFFAFTVMMFTPIVTTAEIADQIAVGGFRYFSLLGIIPATHIFMEILEHPKFCTAGPIRQNVLLFFQVALLVDTCAVNMAALYLLAPILLAVVFALWTHRGDRPNVRAIFARTRFAAITALVLIAGYYALTPHAYRHTGRGGEVVWHRALISLGANPAWPFGTLREVYGTCEQYIPEGLTPGIFDRNGHCIWLAYATAQHIPLAEVIAELYGSRYEAAMRSAFFDIARAYPVQTFETFVIYKPRMIAATLGETLRFDFSNKGPASMGLLVVQFVSLFAFGYFCMSGLPPRTLRLILAEVIICIPCACGLYLVAWSIPHTSGDLLFWLFALFAVALVSFVRLGKLKFST